MLSQVRDLIENLEREKSITMKEVEEHTKTEESLAASKGLIGNRAIHSVADDSGDSWEDEEDDADVNMA